MEAVAAKTETIASAKSYIDYTRACLDAVLPGKTDRVGIPKLSYQKIEGTPFEATYLDGRIVIHRDEHLEIAVPHETFHFVQDRLGFFANCLDWLSDRVKKETEFGKVPSSEMLRRSYVSYTAFVEAGAYFFGGMVFTPWRNAKSASERRKVERNWDSIACGTDALHERLQHLVRQEESSDGRKKSLPLNIGGIYSSMKKGDFDGAAGIAISSYKSISDDPLKENDAFGKQNIVTDRSSSAATHLGIVIAVLTFAANNYKMG